MSARRSFTLHRTGTALAVASVLLLGCARKVQIEVPANFHGHIQIVCAGLTDDRSVLLRVDNSGHAILNTCPERQSDTAVTRTGTDGPIAASVMWTTTGDGIVREISIDVP